MDDLSRMARRCMHGVFRLSAESHFPKRPPRILSRESVIADEGCSQRRLTTELLERDYRLVEFVVVIYDDFLIRSVSDDQTGVAPAEVVHPPERIQRQEERVNGVPEDRSVGNSREKPR